MPVMARTNIPRRRCSIFTRSARSRGQIAGLHVAIVGDILFSRVARSNIFGLLKLGAHVTLVGPSTLVPREFEKLGVEISHKIDEVLPKADVVNLLRIQHERQRREYFPGIGEYIRFFGLTKERAKLLKPDCLIMHPGPINRGVEIDSEVADGSHSVILDQVTNGLAVRMAVLYLCGGISTMSTTIIRNGRVIDPANKRDEIADLYIADGRIADESDDQRSEIRNRRDRRERIDRGARVDRHARASARARIQSQGND